MFNKSQPASKGYLIKLARVINQKHHSGFDDTKFCKKHNVERKESGKK